jgi:hypothetical protein
MQCEDFVISKFEGTVFNRKADGFAFFVSPLGRIWDIGDEMAKFWPDITQVLNVMGMARHIVNDVIDIKFDDIWIFAIPDTVEGNQAVEKLLAKCVDNKCQSVNLVGTNNMLTNAMDIPATDIDLAICISE